MRSTLRALGSKTEASAMRQHDIDKLRRNPDIGNIIENRNIGKYFWMLEAKH